MQPSYLNPEMLRGAIRHHQRPSIRRRHDSWIARLLATLIIGAIITLPGGWALMLAVGVIHHEWITQCPTIGFGWATLLAALIRLALLTIPTRDSK